MTLDDFPPTFLRVFAGLFGLLWGSFLNVVIYRVPRGMSVSRPASHCPQCNTPIRPWNNVPVLSFLILRGRTSCCKATISPRYPMVELIGGVLSLAILEIIVFRLPATTPVGRAGAIYVADLALALGLVAAAFIDLEFMEIPDSVTYGGAVIGFATASFRDLSFLESAIGAAAGFLTVWLLFIVIYPKIRGGKVGMGLGDAKLLMLAGAWFGWRGAAFALCAGALQGSIILGLVLLFRGRIDDPEAVKREREELKRDLEALPAEERAAIERELAGDPLAEEPDGSLRRARVAFGPFLILATLECLFAGREIFSFYGSFLEGS